MSMVVGNGAATYRDNSAPSLVAREISDSKAASFRSSGFAFSPYYAGLGLALSGGVEPQRSCGT
jgi:hypothetical protein